ncbi:MAG: DUF1178 family protein [Rhodobacter sp.]|nr:DUF1178 family protein [Rhodobacter sp.]
MIRYALKCSAEHGFESWFKSAEAYDSLKAANMVACPVCGETDVSKAIMAPRVSPARSKAEMPVPAQPERPLRAPVSEAEAVLSELRKHVEENSDYVGLGFAAEARRMHDGDIPHRSIYGEARRDEARKLLEDGVPVAPLPFIPIRKTN